MINISTLKNVCLIVQKTLDEETSYEAVFEIIDTGLEFDNATLFIRNEENDKLEVAVQRGEKIVEIGREFSFGKGFGLSGWSAQTEEPIIISSFMNQKPDRLFNSFLSIPCLIEKKLVGVVNLGSKSAGLYDEKDRDAYILIGLQIAFLIEKLKLRGQIDAKNRELQNTLKELKTAQNELIEKERLAAIGEITVSVNHEINNPLSVILGYTELLTNRFKKSEPDIESINRLIQGIQESARGIQNVTQRLSLIESSSSETYIGGTKMTSIPKENK